MKNKRLTFCQKQAALWIVRGHDMRRADYNAIRKDIISQIRGSGDKKDAEPAHQAELLEQLNGSKEYKYIIAVEDAAEGIGRDLPDGLRVRLKRAILMNCENGKSYPFEYLNCDFVSRRDFYYRKDRFLRDVFDGL